jgi:hypothetical protein
MAANAAGMPEASLESRSTPFWTTVVVGLAARKKSPMVGKQSNVPPTHCSSPL